MTNPTDKPDVIGINVSGSVTRRMTPVDKVVEYLSHGGNGVTVSVGVMREALEYAGFQHIPDDVVMVPRDTIDQIEQWAEAYPLAIFPEPDMAVAREVLKSAGITLDAVSASNIRHVITRVKAMLEASE